jgi:hypothetical protein
VANWLKPIANREGSFRTSDVGHDRDVDFVPFYRLHRTTYAVYWDTFTPDEWQKKSQAYVADEEKQRKLQAATVGYAQPGEMQPERDYNFQGEESETAELNGRPARRGSKWFSFDLPVEATNRMALIVTYNSEQRATRTFNVLVDGKRVGDQSIERQSPEQVAKFFDVEYAIPAELVAGKQKVTVRFEAAPESEIAAVFGIRMIRADAER